MRRMWIYDVFLSFRGPDVRRGFVDHLYNAFKKEGIHAFLDAHEVKKGEDINVTIKHAIHCSRIRIPILSQDYATSVWCLNELSLIARLQDQDQGRTIPLFYKVCPSHVRHPDRSESPFAQAFQHHQSTGRHSEQQIREWKAALFTVSNISGWSLDDTNGCVG